MRTTSLASPLLALLIPALTSSACPAGETDLRETRFGRAVQGALDAAARRAGDGAELTLRRLSFDADALRLTGEVACKAGGRVDRLIGKGVGVAFEASARVTVDGSNRSVDVRVGTPSGKTGVSVFGQDLGDCLNALDLPAETLAGLLDGDLGAALASVPTFGAGRREFEDDYAKVKADLEAEYGGPQNVYFPSRAFVDAMSPSRFLAELLRSAGPDGPPLRDTLGRASRLAAGEGRRLLDWLRVRGPLEAGRFLRVRSAAPSLSASWRAVEYRSRAVLFDTWKTPWAAEPHAAFYIALAPKRASPSPSPRTAARTLPPSSDTR